MQADAGTYGALLLGALVASGLSGVFGVQCLLYFKCYPTDTKSLKALVIVAWGLEVIHTVLVWVSIWAYFIKHFGETEYVDHIPSGIALSVILTATLTFLAHCLFAHRIYYLSERSLWLTLPIIILALCRLAAATVSGVEMIHLRSFTRFRNQFLWLFTLGLSLSSAVDILITLSLFFLLRKSRRQSIKLNYLIDALLLYTFEIGSLTSAATVAAMLCWSTISNSLIFLGFHFVIGKLYANSLLATLNSRRRLRRARSAAFNDFVNFNVNQAATVSAIRFQGADSRQLGDSDTQLAGSIVDPESLKPKDVEEQTDE